MARLITKCCRPEATCKEMMLLRQLTPFVGSLGPASFRRWVVERLSFRTLRSMIHISDTLHLRSSEIFQARKAAMGNEEGDTKDIISILRKPFLTTFLSLNLTQQTQ